MGMCAERMNALQAFAHGAGHPAVDDIAERIRRRCQDKRDIGWEIGIVTVQLTLATVCIPLRKTH